jgi:hypothetical protein
LNDFHLYIERKFGYESTFLSAEEIHAWPVSLRPPHMRYSTLKNKNRTSTLKSLQIIFIREKKKKRRKKRRKEEDKRYLC